MRAQNTRLVLVQVPMLLPVELIERIELTEEETPETPDEIFTLAEIRAAGFVGSPGGLN